MNWIERVRLAAIIVVVLGGIGLWIAFSILNDKLETAKRERDAARAEVRMLQRVGEANAKALESLERANARTASVYREAISNVQSLPPLPADCLASPRLAAAYAAVERLRNDNADAPR